jgi:hypothetical protein
MPPSTESVAPVTNELDDDDLGALGGEQPRGRRADAAPAARDQRHLVAQSVHAARQRIQMAESATI